MPRSRIIFLAILAVAILIAIFFGVARPQLEQAGNDSATQQAITRTQNATATARANITTVRINYGTEKDSWLKAATERFAQVHPEIRVELIGQGSMASYNALSQVTDDKNTFDGSKPIPTLWSPAASIQVNLLNSETTSPTKLSRELAINCKPLVLSPMAIMVWEDRAAAFEAAYKDKGGITLQNIADALSGPAQGNWGNLGGNPDWGLIKIGYTNPYESNSGTMMVVALANNFYNKAARITGAEASAPDFQKFMATLSNAVSQSLLSSSGLLMRDVIARGPASYDMVIVYEALGIENFKNAVGRHRQTIRFVYPRFNLYSDHPLCIVDHPSITPAEREAAKVFQEFLLSKEIQSLALTYGYRPADVSIPLFGANTVFDDADIQAAGVGANVGQELVLPEGATITQLLTLWRRSYTGS